MTAFACSTAPLTCGVDTLSVTGRKWVLRPADERQVLAIAQRHQLSDMVARLLVARHVDLSQVSAYLDPTLKALMPDPLHLKDMAKAVQHVQSAIEGTKKIAVFGDYDVDGATATATLHRYFFDSGVPITVYIPDRIQEGYGPNIRALEKLYQQGHRLVILVDCGTTAFEVLETAEKMGLKIIVLDHHTAQPTLPAGATVVNPNRLDETSPLRHLCAAGIAFLFVVALHRALCRSGWFEGKVQPDLLQYLDLVALGTVCDVMPLTGLNRAYVRQGLRVMRRRSNVGIAALADVAQIPEAPSAYHLGFVFGPRLNAGGRVGDSAMGSRILSTRDPQEAAVLAQELDVHNQQRRLIEAEVFDQALQQIHQKNLTENPVLMVNGDGWHPGVIGIVAGRLKERYHRPVCVVSFDKKGLDAIGKGSGRSIPGASLGDAMHVAHHKGLLIAGGGHAMAAGFSVQRAHYTAFYDFLNTRLGSEVQDRIPLIQVDSVLSFTAVTPEFLQQLSKLEPYGVGNPTPKFIFKHVQIVHAQIVGRDHIRCRLKDEAGISLKAMCFRAVDTPLGDFLLSAQGKSCHVVGTLKQDEWQGRTQMTLMLEDINEVLFTS